MTRANHEQLERAAQLLAYEGGIGSVDGLAEAAGSVYDKLHAHLAPLVGATGVQLLLVRSAKLARREFACLANVPLIQNSTDMRDRLRALDPVVARDAAEALFGTFFALIATFVGERLATQLLRTAWPTLEAVAPTETRK